MIYERLFLIDKNIQGGGKIKGLSQNATIPQDIVTASIISEHYLVGTCYFATPPVVFTTIPIQSVFAEVHEDIFQSVLYRYISLLSLAVLQLAFRMISIYRIFKNPL